LEMHEDFGVPDTEMRAVALNEKKNLFISKPYKINKQIQGFEWVPIAIGTTMSFLSDQYSYAFFKDTRAF